MRHFCDLRARFVIMVAIKDMKVTHSLSSRPQGFSYGRTNGEENWLGLGLMHVTAKLTIFLRLSLQEECVLCVCVFVVLFYEAPFGRHRVGLTGVWLIYIRVYMCMYTGIYMDYHA
jgi:hypothetical protein